MSTTAVPSAAAQKQLKQGKVKKGIFSVIRHLVLALLAFIWLVPIAWLLLTSFSTDKGINFTRFVPESFTMWNYVSIMTQPDSVAQFPRWFMNTLVVACFNCVISTCFVLMVAYAISCCRFKGRGGSEQFHGAVVDHDGRDDTRVFNEVTATNEALAALTPVCGSLPKADAAMIFDWDNRWALDDAWGMQIKQKNLRETCCQLYAQLNHCGVETDVVGVDADLNRYKLVVLPMLFMTKPGFAQKIREYVENGGTVVATYLLGYVDESTLCWLGGFPGDGLREVFGVTASELDTLYPGEGNRAIWVKSSQQSSIKDYCELLQPAEGTEVVAVYGQDFYSGHAAVTHHVFGKGHAYYIGARLDDAGNAAVLRAALADAKVHLRDLPQGVEYHCRESENARYHFYINTTQSAVKVQVESGADLLSGKNVLGSMELKPYDACAIEEKVK